MVLIAFSENALISGTRLEERHNWETQPNSKLTLRFYIKYTYSTLILLYSKQNPKDEIFPRSTI